MKYKPQSLFKVLVLDTPEEAKKIQQAIKDIEKTDLLKSELYEGKKRTEKILNNEELSYQFKKNAEIFLKENTEIMTDKGRKVLCKELSYGGIFFGKEVYVEDILDGSTNSKFFEGNDFLFYIRNPDGTFKELSRTKEGYLIGTISNENEVEVFIGRYIHCGCLDEKFNFTEFKD